MPIEEKVEINAYTYPMEAEIAAMLLGQNEIECELLNVETVNANPFLSNAVGGIKLVVNQKDAENAIKIIKEDEIKRKNEHDNYCYNCESDEIEKLSNKVTWKTIIIAILTLGIGIQWTFKHFKCNKCGCKW